MKKIVLTRIKGSDFKGLKSFDSPEIQNEFNIFGKNRKGKTSVFDLYTWVLYGKNSEGKSDFGIKQRDENNNIVLNKNPWGELSFLVDDFVEIKFKRVLEEVWRKTTGEIEAKYIGDTTKHYVNDSPVSPTEFSKRVDELLSESLFKILSDPMYFNRKESFKMPEKRDVLFALTEKVSDDEVLKGIDSNFAALINDLFSQKKNLEDAKREFKAKRELLEEELAPIKPKIEQNNLERPKVQEWDLIEKQIAEKQSEKTKIENQLADKTKANDAEQKKIVSIQQQKFLKEQELKNLTQKIDSERSSESKKLEKEKADLQHLIYLDESKLKTAKTQFQDLQAEKTKLEEKGKTKDQEIKDLRAEYKEEAAKTIDLSNEDDYKCDKCGTPFDLTKKDQIKIDLQAEFDKKQLEKLESINKKGLPLKEEIEKIKKDLEAKEAEIEKVDRNLTQIVEIIEYQKQKSSDLDLKIKEAKETESKDRGLTNEELALQKEIDLIVIPEIKKDSEEVNIELENQKTELENQITALREKLFVRKQISDSIEAEEKLQAEMLRLSQEIANFQKYEIAIKKFNDFKVETLEKRVNEKFKFTKWKMFELQKNGTYKDVCTATYNGVDYTDLNTESMINVGIDIINTFSREYNVIAPIWIDNRESVTKLFDTDSQVINLVVYDEFQLKPNLTLE